MGFNTGKSFRINVFNNDESPFIGTQAATFGSLQDANTILGINANFNTLKSQAMGAVAVVKFSCFALVSYINGNTKESMPSIQVLPFQTIKGDKAYESLYISPSFYAESVDLAVPSGFVTEARRPFWYLDGNFITHAVKNFASAGQNISYQMRYSELDKTGRYGEWYVWWQNNFFPDIVNFPDVEYIKIIFVGIIPLTQDPKTYFDFTDQSRKILYNERNNINKLNNNTRSVYNNLGSNLHFGLMVYNQAPSLDGSDAETISKTLQINHKWYGVGINNLVDTNFNQASIKTFVNGFETNYFKYHDNTEIHFTVNSNLNLANPLLDVELMAWVMRVDNSSNPNEIYPANYSYVHNRIIDETGIDVDLPKPLISDYGVTLASSWDYTPTPTSTNFWIDSMISKGKDSFLVGPAQKLTNIGGNTWLAKCNVKKFSSEIGAKYRIIGVIYYKTTPTDELHGSFSFISEEISVDITPGECPIESGGYLSDYNNHFSERLIVSPQERIKTTVFFNGDAYTQCRKETYNLNHAFLPAIKTLKLIIYYIDENNPNIAHVLEDKAFSRSNSGAWTNTEGFEVSEDANSPYYDLMASYVFRIRYEKDVTNLYTLNLATNQTNLSASKNQDWTNKTLVLRWELMLYQNTPAEFNDLVYRYQYIKVHDYDEKEGDVLEIKFFSDNGLELHTFCSDDNGFNAKVTTKYDDDSLPFDANEKDMFLAGVDEKAFNINKFRENEIFQSNTGINQLQQTPIVSIDSQFSEFNGGVAYAYCESSFFNQNKRYRFVAFKKKGILNDYDACNANTFITSGTIGYVKNKITLPNSDSNIVFFFNAFENPKAFRILYNGMRMYMTRNWVEELCSDYPGPPNPCYLKVEDYDMPSNDFGLYDNYFRPSKLNQIRGITWFSKSSNFQKNIDIESFGGVIDGYWDAQFICDLEPIKIEFNDDISSDPNILFPQPLFKGSVQNSGVANQIISNTFPYNLVRTFTSASCLKGSGYQNTGSSPSDRIKYHVFLVDFGQNPITGGISFMFTMGANTWNITSGATTKRALNITNFYLESQQFSAYGNNLYYSYNSGISWNDYDGRGDIIANSLSSGDDFEILRARPEVWIFGKYSLGTINTLPTSQLWIDARDISGTWLTQKFPINTLWDTPNIGLQDPNVATAINKTVLQYQPYGNVPLPGAFFYNGYNPSVPLYALVIIKAIDDFSLQFIATV